jgi:hypothetical protein
MKMLATSLKKVSEHGVCLFFLPRRLRASAAYPIEAEARALGGKQRAVSQDDRA